MFSGSSPSRKALVIAAGCVAIALLVFLGVRRGGDAPRDLAFTELLSLVDQGKVRAIAMSPDSMRVDSRGRQRGAARSRRRDTRPRTRPS